MPNARSICPSLDACVSIELAPENTTELYSDLAPPETSGTSQTRPDRAMRQGSSPGQEGTAQARYVLGAIPRTIGTDLMAHKFAGH